MSNNTIDKIDIIAPLPSYQNFMFLKYVTYNFKTSKPNQQMIFSYKKEKDFFVSSSKVCFSSYKKNKR